MRITLRGLLLLACALPVATAAQPLEAEYVVRWSGLEVGRLATELRRDGDRYHLAYRAHTSGALRWIADFRSEGWSSGRFGAAGPQPEHFRGRNFWRDGESFWRVGFAADGSVSELELDADTRADREPVPAPLRQGPDPLSLALAGMLGATAGGEQSGQSFDGRRVVQVRLACATERSPITPVALGPAPRPALACTASGELVAGRSKRWGARGEPADGERPPTRVWLVPDLGGVAHWPVRVEAESRWGTVTIELESFTEPAA